MGLDMSIILKRKVSKGKRKEVPTVRYYYKGEEEIASDLPDKNGKFKNHLKYMRKADYAMDVFELAYWRKANAIHRWFVLNVQNDFDNCGEYRLTKENLVELRRLALDVLEHCTLKKGKIKNGYVLKKNIFGKMRRKYNVVDGKVLTRKSIKYCEKYLPTQECFFFGNTQYNEFYVNDLSYTIDIIEKILDNYDLEKEEIYYTSSW